MQLRTPLALALLALATGCASHEHIIFSDEAEMRAPVAAAPAATQKHLEPADESQIEQLVFSYMIEHRLWNVADVSAVFLEADDAEVNALIKKYPHFVPPIKPGDRAELKSHKPLLDKDTQRPAIVLTVDVDEPNADGTVDANGRWYAGDTVAGFRGFHLKKAAGVWQIVDVK